MNELIEQYPVDCGGSRSVQFLYVTGWHDVSDWRMPVHQNYCKVNFFVTCTARVLIGSQVYDTPEYDLILYRPYATHFGAIPFGQEMEYYELQITPDVFDGFPDGTRLRERLFAGEGRAYAARHREKMRQSFAEMLELLRSDGNRTELYARLLLLLTRISAEAEPDHFPEPSGVSRPLNEILRLIDTQSVTLQTVGDIADRTFFSPSYISRLFRNSLRTTPYAYLQACKLSHARRLLEEGKSVSDACGLAGFRNYPAFIRLFRERLGKSPLQYQKERMSMYASTDSSR